MVPDNGVCEELLYMWWIWIVILAVEFVVKISIDLLFSDFFL
jgi:hypothetical protein